MSPELRLEDDAAEWGYILSCFEQEEKSKANERVGIINLFFMIVFFLYLKCQVQSSHYYPGLRHDKIIIAHKFWIKIVIYLRIDA